MKIMFSILGEGRGHMTQAIAAKELLERAGHQVTQVLLGVGPHRPAAPFLASAMNVPITQIPAPGFVFKNNRQVNLPASLAGIVRQFPAYGRGLRAIHAAVREHQPDVILNFFEPLTGLYAFGCRQRPPVIAIGHQFMFEHHTYVRAPGKWAQLWGMKWYVRLVGAASTRVALSLYEAEDLPEKNLRVAPPLLRPQLFDLQPTPGKFVLVYMLNHGYADQVIAWHKNNPATELHCFYDKPGAPPEFKYDETLTFHKLDGGKFIRMMAECKQVACTAGFESLAEAAWLGKPLFLMPVENHVEQEMNAMDATRQGLGISSDRFDFDRLSELPERLSNQSYRDWVKRGDSLLLRTIEEVVAKAAEATYSNSEGQQVPA